MIRLSTQGLSSGKHWTRVRVSNLVAAIAALMLFASSQVSRTAPDLEISEPRLSVNGTEQQASSNEVAVELEDSSKDDNPIVTLNKRQNRGLKLSLFKFRR